MKIEKTARREKIHDIEREIKHLHSLAREAEELERYLKNIAKREEDDDDDDEELENEVEMLRDEVRRLREDIEKLENIIHHKVLNR